MEKVGAELNRSKQLREKQLKEFQRQNDEVNRAHEQQIAELKMKHEQDCAALLQDFHAEKELWQSERDAEVKSLRDAFHGDLAESDMRAKDRAERDLKVSGLQFLICCHCNILIINLYSSI